MPLRNWYNWYKQQPQPFPFSISFSFSHATEWISAPCVDACDIQFNFDWQWRRSNFCYRTLVSHALSSGFFILSRFLSIWFSMMVLCMCLSLSLSLASTPVSFVHCVLVVRVYVWVWPGVGNGVSGEFSVFSLVCQDTLFLRLIYFLDQTFCSF